MCTSHPAHASELRRRFELLRATGLYQDTDEAPPAIPDLPTQLGEFRLLRRLGSGGMGVVFAAEQGSLGREVAIKVVRPEFLFSPAARERFRRESEAIAKLEHPAIIPVLTHGEERGVPYYVMPLLRGSPADEVIRQFAGRDPRRLTAADLHGAIIHGDDRQATAAFAGTWWEACVRLMRHVALGLQHAHSRGIVHRDVKPSNIMLTTDGRALLFDFGLAHVRDDARITRSGAAPGSPAYMSPEQVRGRATDERTDVYSLAATLHHLLSLSCPFPIHDDEVLRARILAGTSEPLRHLGLPRELQLVLAAAMDVDREQRHASAAALAEDLQAVLERRPILARRLPMGLRLRRWCSRNRTAAVGVAALLALAAIVPGALWLQQRATNAALHAQTEKAQNQATRAERNFARSLTVIDEMLLRVGDEKLRNLPAAQAVAAELMQQAVDYFDLAAAEESDASGFRQRHIFAIQRLAAMRMDLGELATAEALAERSLQMLRKDGGVAGTDRARRAQAGMTLAVARLRGGKLNEAMAAVDVAEQELRDPPPDMEEVPGVRGRIATTRAGILEQCGDAAGARAAFTAALVAFREQARRGGPGARREAAVGAYNLARMLRRDNDTDAARELLAEATASLEGVDEHEGVWPTAAMIRALVQAELGLVHKAAGDLAGCANALTEAIAQGERLAARYPAVARLRRDLGGNRCNLAAVFTSRRDFATSRGLLVVAVAELERALRDEPGDGQTAKYLHNARQSLCAVLRESGDWAALADAAREFGRLPGEPAGPRGAARHLLRCAEQATGEAAAGLREEALLLLLESERRGWGSAKLDDVLYLPLQTDSRFVALRVRIGETR